MLRKLLISCLLMVTFIQVLPAQNKKTQKLVGDYLNVALKDRGSIAGKMARWEKDTVTYRIFGQMDFLSRKEWNKFLAEIESLTKIKFVETESSFCDILLYFGTVREYAAYANAGIPANLVDKYSNWNHAQRSGITNELTKASGCLDPSKPQLLYKGTRDVKYMFLRAIGMHAGLDDQYSLFNSGQFKGTVKLSRQDKRLIKLHYHQDLKSGMDRSQLREALYKIKNIDELAVEKL